jgi:hypothetical protein
VKLDAVYAALRGRVPTTGVIDPARREAGFARLKAARDAALNINHWHHFVGALRLAGYRSQRMPSAPSGTYPRRYAPILQGDRKSANTRAVRNSSGNYKVRQAS